MAFDAWTTVEPLGATGEDGAPALAATMTPRPTINAAALMSTIG
jgi:hypothetical protein